MEKSNNDYMNNENPTNPKLKEPEEKVSSVYIICAAVWIKDGKIHVHQPRNIEKGLVVGGRRHHNCFLTVQALSEKSAVMFSEDRIIQGFLTSDDRFVDREEGGKIAFAAGQTSKLKSCLFSEDLY